MPLTVMEETPCSAQFTYTKLSYAQVAYSETCISHTALRPKEQLHVVHMGLTFMAELNVVLFKFFLFSYFLLYF